MAWIDENNGFLGGKLSRDGREADWGTTEKLDEGAMFISGPSSSVNA